MELSRRDLAAAGALAVAFGATSLIGPALAESGDEAAVKKAVEDMRTAYIKQDKAALEAMTMPQLTYSHSSGRIEDKAQFIKGVMDRKSTLKSLEFPDFTIHVVGDVAIARHLWCRSPSSTARRPISRSASSKCTRSRTAAGSCWRALLTPRRSRHNPPAHGMAGCRAAT